MWDMRLINIPIRGKASAAVKASVGCVVKAVWVWSQMGLLGMRQFWSSAVFLCGMPSYRGGCFQIMTGFASLECHLRKCVDLDRL